MDTNVIVPPKRAAEHRIVDRVHVLETIDGIFSDEIPVVFVEGESGCGSTVLLKQFSDYKKDRCFQLFVKPASRFSYSLDYLRLVLAEQFADYLQIDLSVGEAVDEALFASLTIAVRKKAKGRHVYFVVDGLQQIPEAEKLSVESIFSSVLPVGQSGFRFLITGAQERFAPFVGVLRSKNYTVQKLSKSESMLMLEALSVSEDRKYELATLCKGLPGRLVSVRSIVSNDADADSLLNASLSEYPDFIAIEMKPISRLSNSQKLVIALIANSKYALARSKLKQLSGGSEDDLIRVSESCSFIKITDEHPFSEFSSETYRRYAEKLVEAQRSKAIALQIEYLAANPASEEAVKFLPAYYQSVNQQQAIVDMLDNDHYTQLLETTGSYSSLQMRAAMGAKSASELKHAASIFQFALQRSIFANIASSAGFKSQVGALVALGRDDEALSLATQAPTLELRLKMMSEYARYLAENGMPIDKSILESIRESTYEMAEKLNEDDVEELAENAAYFDIDLAIELLDKLEEKGRESKDEALLKLTIATTRSRVSSDVAERTSKKVSSDRHRALIAFIANTNGGPAISDIEAISKNLSVEKRIFFLRCVLAGPRISKGAIDLVNYALDQVVSNAGYLPKIRDLADFATPLSYCKGNREEVEAVIGRLEAQLGLAERSSASVPLIDLKMKLAIAQAGYDFQSSHDRLIDAYVEAGSIELPDAKAESLALMLRALKRIDSEGVIDRKDSLSAVLKAELLATLSDLLRKTANHVEVSRSALQVMTSFDPGAALKLASELNTFASRDESFETIASHLVSGEANQDAVDKFHAAVASISESWRRQNAIVTIIKTCLRGVHRLSWAPVLSKLALDMSVPTRAADALLMMIEIFTISHQEAPIELVDRLKEVEGSISSGLTRCETLYRGAALLAKQLPEVGSDLYERAEITRSSFHFISDVGVYTVRICLSLLLRAARPLIVNGLFEDSYLSRFSLLCQAIPDPCGRVAHMADLALKAAVAGKLELAVKIISNHCSPVYESDLSEDDKLYVGTLIFAPSYMVRGAISLKYLVGVDTIARDQAIVSLCLTMLSGVTDADARPPDLGYASITYETAETVLSLLDEMESDVLIAAVARSLVTVCLSKGSKTKIAGHQRAGIKSELIRIGRAKLPQKDSISHAGYLIEVEAYACQLTDTHADTWTKLYESTCEIPNIADRVLVKCEIARALPSKFSALAKKLLQESRDDIREIPSAYDRLGRMEALVEAAKTVDVFVSKAAIRDGLAISFEIEDDVVAEQSRRKLLDMAEQFDPKGLDELVNSVDDDPARANAKIEMKQQVRIQKFRRKIADAKGSVDDADFGGDVLPSAAQRNLVSLVGGRAEPLAPDLLNKYVSACGEWDLPRAFPVLSWYLETLARRVRRSEDALAKCAPPWEVLLLSSELAINFLSRSGNKPTQILMDVPSGVRSGILVSRDETGSAGRDFIRDWLGAASESSDGRVLISDPYFKPADMDIVRMIVSEVPGARIRIITSKAEMSKLSVDSYEAAWIGSIDLDPPDVEIIGISDFESSKAPIHDRWVICGDRGLRMGTSFGGMGSRWSEVSELESDLVGDVGGLLASYAEKAREVAGRKVSYLTVTL